MLAPLFKSGIALAALTGVCGCGNGTWQARSAPDIRGPSAMSAVMQFVATNGWSMHTGGVLFTYGGIKTLPLKGLPWKDLVSRELPAVTDGGILYVPTEWWHHDCNGVAYNPNTNRFPDWLAGFKPIGDHWYVWGQPEFPTKLTRRYEGER